VLNSGRGVGGDCDTRRGLWERVRAVGRRRVVGTWTKDRGIGGLEMWRADRSRCSCCCGWGRTPMLVANAGHCLACHGRFHESGLAP